MFADGFKRRYTTIPFAFSKLEDCKDRYQLFAHHHKEIELIAMMDGEAEFYIGSVQHTLQKGDVLIIPPYSVHHAAASAGTSYDCICFDLSLLWDKELRGELEAGRLTVKAHLAAQEPDTSDMHRYAREAIRACKDGAPGWEMEVIGWLSVLFSTLKRRDLFAKVEAPRQENTMERAILSYIQDHASEPITSTALAREFYIHPSYFCRLFKQRFGCCFSKYLLEYRIGCAKLYLKSTSESVSQIAFKTGFHSFSYFSKMFKRMVGTSPTEYRQKSASRMRGHGGNERT